MPKVLTIEDDATTASEIVRALVEQGFDVEHVGDGIEGLKRASTGAYDAITLDRTLPGLDGLSIASTRTRQGFDTPILMITAMNDVDERVKGLRAGGMCLRPTRPVEVPRQTFDQLGIDEEALDRLVGEQAPRAFSSASAARGTMHAFRAGVVSSFAFGGGRGSAL